MKEWRYEDEWFEESRISGKIEDYLKKKGYEITKSNVNKKNKGHDIVAKKDNLEFIFEIKGFPSDKYVSGEKKGQKKPTPPNLQATHWFAEALLSLIIAKSKEHETNIAMGLPFKEKYKELINKITYFRKQFALTFYLVDENGKITEVSPDDCAV
jgi:hypothetical protein